MNVAWILERLGEMGNGISGWVFIILCSYLLGKQK